MGWSGFSDLPLLVCSVLMHSSMETRSEKYFLYAFLLRPRPVTHPSWSHCTSSIEYELLVLKEHGKTARLPKFHSLDLSSFPVSSEAKSGFINNTTGADWGTESVFLQLQFHHHQKSPSFVLSASLALGAKGGYSFLQGFSWRMWLPRMWLPSLYLGSALTSLQIWTFRRSLYRISKKPQETLQNHLHVLPVGMPTKRCNSRHHPISWHKHQGKSVYWYRLLFLLHEL